MKRIILFSLLCLVISGLFSSAHALPMKGCHEFKGHFEFTSDNFDPEAPQGFCSGYVMSFKDVPTFSVPEPSGMLLLGSGLVLVGLATRRRTIR